MRKDDDGTRTMMGVLIAPACAAFAAAAGMLAERTGAGLADMGAAEMLGRLFVSWLPALAYAYPAFIGFILIVAVLNGLGHSGRGVLALCGGLAGGAAMSVHLYRVHGADFLFDLVGGPLAEASLQSLASGLALPAAGIVAGMIGGLIFAPFAYGWR